MRAVAIACFLFSASFIWTNVFGWYKAYETVKRNDQPTVQQGDVIGTLFMPKLNISMPIYEGLQQLNKGVALDERSALPGKGNHTVLAGHRDTVFRQLGDIHRGDELVIRTNDQTWTYVVQHIRIVKPDDKTVLVPKAHPTLTLITCYPFRWIGDAPNRYVVIAKQKGAG